MKYQKSEVDYKKGLPQAHCGICEHYRNGRCSLVEGPIDSTFWCNKFHRSLRKTVTDAVRGRS